MLISDRFINQLIRHEGTKKSGEKHMPYKCPAGKLTIGFGRNIEDNGITDAEARTLLRNDILTAESELRTAFPWFDGLDEVRQGVLVNMAFNMGTPKLKGFKKTLAYIEAGKYKEAAAEMLDSAWARQVKGRAAELASQMETGEFYK